MLINLNFGVDELFVEAYGAKSSPCPGRMSPFTTIFLIILSTSLVLLFYGKKRKVLYPLTLLLVQVVLVVSIISALGYQIDLETAYSFSNMTPFTIYVSFNFILLSLGLHYLIKYLSYRKGVFLKQYNYILVLFRALMATAVFSTVLSWNERLHMEREVTQHSQYLTFRLDAILSRYETALHKAIEIWPNLDPSDKRTASEIELFLSLYPKIDFMEWVTKNNESINFSQPYIEKNTSLSVCEKSKNQQIPGGESNLYATPIDNKGVLYCSIPKQNSKYSSISMMVDFTDILNESLPPKIMEMYAIKITSGSNTLYTNSQNYDDLLYLETSVLTRLNTDWVIKIWPTKSFLNEKNTILPELAFFAGLMISLLLLVTNRNYHVIKHQIDEIQETKSLLSRAQQIANLGTWIWNLKTDTVWVSPEARAILHVDQDMMSAQEFLQLIQPEDTARLATEIREIRSGKPSLLDTFVFIDSEKKSHYLRLDARVSKLQHQVPVEMIGIIQDITEYKELEHKLLHIQKVETLGQLTGGIAHDFNNILMVILGNLELVNMSLEEGTPEHKKVASAIAASERGSELVKRLLSFARKQVLLPKVVKLQDFLPETNNLLSRTLGENIKTTLEISQDAWLINVDVSQLENAIINLSINARDAMKGIGSLKFSVSNETFDKEAIFDSGTAKPGEYVKISIEDSGCGIPKENLAKVFEPFFTTKPVGHGTGLGLSMVFGFVLQSNGGMTIQSQEGVGTTISLFIPRHVGESLQQDSGPFVLSTDPSKGNNVILVVEDEDSVRDLLLENLSVMGFKTIEARDADEALSLLKKNKNVNLMITDVMMPGVMLGPDLAIAARKILPDLKIIFVSGYAKNHQKLNLEKEHFLQKPYKIHDLANLINKILS